MPKKTEAQAVAAVVDRLAERFPTVERSVIEDMVAHEHSLFAHGRVRDYIPILVERAAKLRLSGRPAQPASAAQPVGPPQHAIVGPMQLARTASAPGGSPGAA
jgi:hypothetical protein